MVLFGAYDCNFYLSYVPLVAMTTTRTEPTDIIPALDSLSISCNSADTLMKAIVALLHEKSTRYNWVGFYMLEKDGNRDVLVLGPFKGAITPHTRIPLDQGICGAAASTGKTVVVDDVNSDARYLACSVETKSEIVVPVCVHGKVVGELDIDSHFAAAFGSGDRDLCEHAAFVLGRFLERNPG
jgi:L-methionine (R)-S-oxide reductase